MVSAKEQSPRSGSLQPLVVKEGSLLVLPQTLCSQIRESGLSAGPAHLMFLEWSQVPTLVSLEPGFRHASHSSSAPMLLPPHPNVLVRATLCGLLGCVLPQYVVVFLTFKGKEKKAHVKVQFYHIWYTSNNPAAIFSAAKDSQPVPQSWHAQEGTSEPALHTCHIPLRRKGSPKGHKAAYTCQRWRTSSVWLWRFSLIRETMQLGPLILQAGTLRCIKEKQLTQ